MTNFGRLISAVQRNCHISDAQYAGNYSMCTFLMKMREYYRWENELPFGCVLANEAVGNWLNEREETWSQLADTPFSPLPFDDISVDPFEDDEINSRLMPMGYVYTSGLGLFGKPHFLLGSLQDATAVDGANVYISACEYARDLVAPPAMTRGDNIFVSQGGLRRFIWERLEESRWSRQEDTPMRRAVTALGADLSTEALIAEMAARETESLVLHETGELRAGRLLGPRWNELLASTVSTRSEFILRAVRDHLADCLSTLPALAGRGAAASLHFYFGNFGGLRRALFPEAVEAYQGWHATGDTGVLLAMTHAGAAHWQSIAEEILASYERDGSVDTDMLERLTRSPDSRPACPANHAS